METSETPQHKGGGITNYFQGATIHNLVINGNMVKNGPDQYTSNGESKKYATPEQVLTASKACKEQGLIWGGAAYGVLFCVCRDEYSMGDNASNFERLLAGGGIMISEGTINTAMSRNPWMKCHIDKWKGMNVAERALKLRDEFMTQIQNLLIQMKKTA